MGEQITSTDAVLVKGAKEQIVDSQMSACVKDGDIKKKEKSFFIS